jgi:hypothetical protein
MLGAEHLVLEVQLGGRSTSGVLYLDRSAISLQTPDRRLLPMMTQPEFLDDYGQLASAAMRVEFQSQGPPDTRVMETPCVDWYFRRPTDGLAVDHLTITPFKPCWGPLFFHVPGGVQPGRWELHIRLEESKAEIPFIVERD